MNLFVLLYLAAGCLLPLCVMRFVNGNFEEWHIVVGWTAGLNLVTGLLAYLLFRPIQPKPILDTEGNSTGQEEPLPDRFLDQLVLAVSYLIGIGAGVYFYNT